MHECRNWRQKPGQCTGEHCAAGALHHAVRLTDLQADLVCSGLSRLQQVLFDLPLWLLDATLQWPPQLGQSAAAVPLPTRLLVLLMLLSCREVVLLKRTLAEQRKHEQERIDTALKDQKRKIARREQRQPSLIDKFLQTK